MIFKEFSIITIGYLIYVQFSPSMGNVWYRNGELNISSVVSLMISPFKKSYMWNRELLIINYPFWLIIGISLLKLPEFIKYIKYIK